MEQRLEDRFIDLPQSHHAQVGSKGIEDANIRHALAMAQAGKAAPGALLRQHRREQIQRMDGGQQRQQMRAPELRRAESPARAAIWTEAETFVDEIVGNIRIEQMEQTVGAGHRELVHGEGAYPFEKVASGLY